jgi:hypothetical protein
VLPLEQFFQNFCGCSINLTEFMPTEQKHHPKPVETSPWPWASREAFPQISLAWFVFSTFIRIYSLYSGVHHANSQ